MNQVYDVRKHFMQYFFFPNIYILLSSYEFFYIKKKQKFASEKRFIICLGWKAIKLFSLCWFLFRKKTLFSLSSMSNVENSFTSNTLSIAVCMLNDMSCAHFFFSKIYMISSTTVIFLKKFLYRNFINQCYIEYYIPTLQ